MITMSDRSEQYHDRDGDNINLQIRPLYCETCEVPLTECSCEEPSSEVLARIEKIHFDDPFPVARRAIRDARRDIELDEEGIA